MKKNIDIDFNNIVEQQHAFAQRVKQLLLQRYNKTPLAFVHTYGCQQNVSDSEHMKALLRLMGFEFCDNAEQADLVLFNTCAVREHAEDRVFGNVGILKRLKNNNREMLIILCGCMTQQQSVADKIKKSYPYVDILFGTHKRYKLPEYIYKRITGGRRIIDISAEDETIVEGFEVERDKKFSAWVPIMQGCNNFCTYCIVPYVRGREISRQPEEILKEVKDLISKGYKEITLLGQNVNSYGKGAEHGVDFSKLLRRINDLEGDFRIRFMTSHPKDCTEKLLDAIRDCEKVCKHIHLPVQCGSDRILRLMNRHYTKEEYLKLVRTAREKIPDVEFTSDIIVGFPGEQYEDFLQTRKLIEEVGFYSLFTFIFSKRDKTPAAEMDDPVDKKEKSKWFAELLQAQEQISLKINLALIGKTCRVFCEDIGRKDGYIAGRTNGYAVVDFVGSESDIGTFKTLKITGFDGVLTGEIIND